MRCSGGCERPALVVVCDVVQRGTYGANVSVAFGVHVAERIGVRAVARIPSRVDLEIPGCTMQSVSKEKHAG